MRRLAYFGILGLMLVCRSANAQSVSQRVTPIDGVPNHGDWIVPAGVGAGVIHQQLNNGGSVVPPMRIESWDDKTENRHWVFTGGANQCRIMAAKRGWKLKRFIPGAKPGEGTCVFFGKQTSFGS